MNNSLPKRSIMFVAGEISGDMHGAYLLRAIKEINTKYSLSFLGIGGEKMQREGMKNICNLTDKSTIGFLEIIKYFPKIYTAYNRAKKLIMSEKPDLLVLIDYQGFNMKLAQFARKQNIKVIYYIAPQEWIWGTVNGGQDVIKYTNKIITVFKEEDDFYKKIGGNTDYVGHPILDIAEDFEKESNLKNTDEDIIGLFPGSRHQEIDRILPIILEIAKKIKEIKPNVRFLLALSSEVFFYKVYQMIKDSGLEIEIIKDKAKEVINNSTLIITASGTITLEAAILEKPMIILYKLSNISYFFARYFLKIKLPYVSLPNIVLRKMVVFEYVQNKIKINDIIKKTIQLMDDKKLKEDITRNLKKVKLLLGEKGAIKRAAESILKEIY